MYYRSATQYLTTALLPLPNYCTTAIPLLLLHYLTTSTTQLLYYCYTPLPRYRATSTTQLLYYTSTSLPRYFDHRTTYTTQILYHRYTAATPLPRYRATFPITLLHCHCIPLLPRRLHTSTNHIRSTNPCYALLRMRWPEGALYHKCNTNFYILHLALSQQVLQTSLRITL